MLPEDEIEELLTPWFGPYVPVEALQVPRLVEIREDGEFPTTDDDPDAIAVVGRAY